MDNAVPGWTSMVTGFVELTVVPADGAAPLIVIVEIPQSLNVVVGVMVQLEGKNNDCMLITMSVELPGAESAKSIVKVEAIVEPPTKEFVLIVPVVAA